MEIAILIVVLSVVGVLGWAGALFLRAGGGVDTLVGARVRRPALPAARAGDAVEPQLHQLSAGVRDHETELRRLRSDHEAELRRLRSDLDEVAREPARLRARVDQHWAEVGDVVAREVARARDDVQARLDADVARLRAEIRSLEGPGDDARAVFREREAEILVELYERLARLETALAAVTNPVLLPGEPYAVPAEFLDPMLKWENWKEVGESAFDFGDYFSRHRLQMDRETADAVTAFIVTLRRTLTRSVHPNLRPRPTHEQLEAIRKGLVAVGQELPSLRRRLEEDYRGLVGEEEG